MPICDYNSEPSPDNRKCVPCPENSYSLKIQGSCVNLGKNFDQYIGGGNYSDSE